MKTCARCGRTYPPEQMLCPACGLALPGGRGPAPADPNAGHIEFLLGQFDEWVRQGWVSSEQARRLYDVYQERRQWLPSGPPPAPPLAPLVTERPQASAPDLPPAPQPPPAARRPSPLAAFFEEQNISFWQLTGALLLLAGLAGLVGWTWGSVGRYLVLALMFGLTGGLYALARSRFVRAQPLTRAALTGVSALLVPLDMVAVNAFRLLGGSLGTDQIGLAAALLCLPLYGWLARRESGRWPAGLLAADGAISVYFGVRAGPARVPEWRGLAYGLSYAALAGLFLLAARRQEPGRRLLWFSTAYGATAAAFGFALWLGGPDILGALASTLLLLALVYGVAAVLFEDRVFVFLSLGALSVGGALGLQHVGLGDWAGRWYWYAAWVQAVGFAAWGAGRGVMGRGRAPLAGACHDSALVLAGLAVVAQAVRAALALGSFPAVGLSGVDLWGMLLPAALSLGFFALLRLGVPSASVLAYAVVLVGLLLSHYAPAHSVPHEQPNLGLFLAAASLLLWRLHRPRVSLISAALGLLACAVYAVANVFWETTVFALPLLIAAYGVQRQSAGALSIWPVAGAAVLEILLLERRLLPWASVHAGWEQNYGLGLFLFCVLGLVLGERLPSRDWTWAALGVAGATALGQLVYAFEGALPYSPLGLLGAGAFLAVGVALVRRSLRAAGCAAGLTGAFYLAFALGYFRAALPAVESAREALVAVGLLVLAVLLGLVAQRQKCPALVYAAMAAAAGEAQGLHRVWHPAPVVYALALWPLAAGLYAAGSARRAPEEAKNAWLLPLHSSALVISLAALAGAVGATLLDVGRSGSSLLVWTVCLYGALYAAAAWATQRGSYAGLAALVLSGAYGLALLRVTPALSWPRLAFFLSLGALFWVAAAQSAARAAAARFAAAALNSRAVAVGLGAILVALLGLSGADDRFIVYTLLVSGSALLGASWGLGRPGWGYVGVSAYFLAYFAFLFKRLGAPGLVSTDFYLIPAGLYVLTLGLLARRARRPAPQTYFLAGLLLVLTPTFVAAWQAGAGPVHSLLLLTECVAALFYGIAARIKVFVGAGTAFLVALLLRETQGMVGHIHWAVYATFLGLGILGSALFFEKRGEEARRWARAVQEKLNEWD